MFTDPFIFYAIRAWLKPTQNVYETQLLASVNDPDLCGKLVEACAATHYHRYHPTY